MSMQLSGEPGFLQTGAEQEVAERLAEIFSASPDPLRVQLDVLPRYMRRKHFTRLIALYELFKQVLDVKGSIVECGVFRGFSLMTFAQLSAVLEPNNLTRRIYGFDSFEGFPSVSEADLVAGADIAPGTLRSGAEKELHDLVEVYERDRFLGHLPKVELVTGDMAETIPTFVAERRHLVVSLLFLDADLYEPTALALQHFLPRMPKGAVIALDNLDNPLWPGEAMAVADLVGFNNLRLRRSVFDPYIAYATIE